MPECQLSRAIKALGLLRILQDAPCIPSPRSSANFPLLLPAATTPFSLFPFLFSFFSFESFHRSGTDLPYFQTFEIFLKGKKTSLSLYPFELNDKNLLTTLEVVVLKTFHDENSRRIRQRLSKLRMVRGGWITISLANVGNG